MTDIPRCPICSMENVYPDGGNYVCADCGHEWSFLGTETVGDVVAVRDVNGNILNNGDSVKASFSTACGTPLLMPFAGQV